MRPQSVSKQQPQQEDGFDGTAAAAAALSSSSTSSPNTLNSGLIRLFWGLLSFLIVLLFLLILVEVPFGPFTQSVLRVVLDFDGNTRYMCSNCTYLVNRLDLVAQRKGMKVKYFDAQIRAVCPAPGSRGASGVKQPTPEEAAATAEAADAAALAASSGGGVGGAGGGSSSSAVSYVEPALLWSPRQGFCRDLFVYYRDQLRQRFRSIVRSRTASSSGKDGGGSGALSAAAAVAALAGRRLPTAPEFCADHCQHNSEAGNLFERVVLEFVDYLQLSPARAGLVNFLRHWGRLCYLCFCTLWILGLVLWWRRDAVSRVRQRQQVERQRVMLFQEHAVLRGALQAEPWTRLIYDESGDPDLVQRPRQKDQPPTPSAAAGKGGIGGGVNGGGNNVSGNGRKNGQQHQHHHRGDGGNEPVAVAPSSSSAAPSASGIHADPANNNSKKSNKR